MFVVGVRVCASSDYAVTRILQALIGTLMRVCQCIDPSIICMRVCIFPYICLSVDVLCVCKYECAFMI